MRGGTIHSGTSFVILCKASTKSNGHWATTYTLLYAYTHLFMWKSKDHLHTMLQLTVFMPISCPMRSRRHLVFERRDVYIRTSCLNARNVINWERNFKENIVKKNLGERIRKEVVIIRIESYFSAFHLGMKCRLNYI